MALRRLSFWAAVLLLASLDLWCSSSSAPCPESCVCRGALLLNCSSAGLSSVPQPVQDPIAELDLSHNLLSSVTFYQPHPNLRNLWLGNNSIPHLSLCVERTVTARRLGRRSAAGSGSRCLTWAPALQLLSAERNLLERLPRGLDAVESLQVLELSFNRISSLEPGVLGDLHQLRELHLQHNLITHLDPQMLQNLEQLQVLDLRFNMLTTMQQLTYLTLRDVGADVKLGGNRWRCDCNMRSIRRQMAYDSTRGMQTWNIICFEPSTVSGKDLLQLDEEDLTCLSSENNLNLHRDVTVYSGAEILLSCSAQESEWWTPDGRASVSQQEDRLLISDFSEGDTGLYVCISEEDHVLSVFNLQISKMRGARQERRLPGVRSQTTPQTPTSRIAGETAGGFTHSDLALAVCLSIFFTFLLAFILGVLARPCIDRLWRMVSKKKDSPATHTVTSAQQRHYDNQAFSNAEEPEEIGHYRERRVTFSRIEVTEENNVQYYDAVASGDQQSIRSDEMFEYQEVEVDLHGRPREKQSDDSSSAELAAERLRNMEFEPIPDPDELEERRSLSSSSDSSVSDQTTRKHTMPKSLQLVEDSFQTRADLSIATKTETPQIVDTKGKSEYPGSSVLHTYKPNTTDSDISQGDEELFEFSDGAQSPSAKTGYDAKSPRDVLEYSSSASSDSSDSDREPMRTKIKQKTKKKQKKVAQKSKPGTSSSSSSHSESKEKMTYDGRGRINIQQLPLQESKTKLDESAERWPAVDLLHIPRLKRRLDIKALLPSSDSSSSRESEDLTKNTQDELMIARRPTNESQKVSPKPGNQLPGFELRKTSANKRPLDPKEPTAGSDSSSSSDSDHDMKVHITQQKQEDLPKSKFPTKVTETVTQKAPSQWPSIDLGRVTRIKRRLDIKAPKADSDSSSSSDSEDEARDQLMKQKQEELLMSRLPGKVSPTMHPKPENRWPVPELGKTTQIKKNVDIKAASTESDSSSSSDSDNERKDYMTSKEQMELHISKVPTNLTTASQKPKSQWPVLDFGRVTRIKRRLDIKAPKADTDSSSSSDSEDEARDQLMKQKQEELLMSRLPGKVSPTVHPKPENRWPAPEFGKTIQIMKNVDIKASSTESDSSSSSDSVIERKDQITQEKQEELYISKLPTNVTTLTQKPANQWPTLDFGRTTKIKRRLDIKAPTADSESSSSSDSEDETRGHVMKPKQEELLMSKLPSKVYPTVHPKPENHWSAPDLGKTTQINKPVDIKAPSTDSDSSSCSESDNERKDQITQKKQEELYISKLPTKETTVTPKPENQWPTIDFGRVKRIKRRLDIKAPTADSDSSSSSDSEDETRGHVMKPHQEELVISQLPGKVPPTVRPKPENNWSAPDLGKTTQIKKPVDIKASSTDSSSSSDSGDDMKDHIKQKKQEKTHISKHPVNVTTSTQKPANQWPTLDFGRTTKIKRRLDIKAPTAESESSSSSDSEYETEGHVMKPKQEELLMSKVPSKVYPSVHPKPENNWSAPDLGKTTQIKKLVDIKGSSTDSDSSFSSDSDNERKDQITQKKQEELYISKLPTNVATSTQKPASQWPSLDFRRTTKIKRRLDIKAPKADSDSSFSSDSEDETRSHVLKPKPEELLTSKLPSKVYPSVHPKPEDNWSAPDFGKTTQIRKPVDIKALSTDSDSSSNSDSDNERKDLITQKQQEELYISKLPTNVTTSTQKPASQWPTLDFGRTTKIKRRLDIKAPKADSESSSSSDSEDETRSHVLKPKPEELLTSKLPSKVYPIVHPKPENNWSTPELGKTTQIKKPVDIKALSTDSDSSSSSDSDNKTKDQITQKKQMEVHISKPLTNVTTATQKPANQWPSLDFGRLTRLKRRLDIKAPTADKDSSSSSDSEDETRGHVMKQKQEELLMSKLPSRVYPTVHPKPENRWSAPDLANITEIKKNVEIKPTSTDSDSSSSSDSDNERKYKITQKQQEELYISKLPTNVTTSTQKPTNQWPTIDFGRVTRIKRRLDIKAPKADSDSSSSSDSEDETGVKKQEELLISQLPAEVPTTVCPKPDNCWSVPDLGKTKEFKNPVVPRTQSTNSDSSSGSDSDSEKDKMTKLKQEDLLISKQPVQTSQKASQKQGNQWPSLDLWKIRQFKRRLDIKAPAADSNSSSSSDSEDETSGHVVQQKQEELRMSTSSTKMTTKVKLENQWPSSVLGKTYIKSPLDIKVPSPSSDSSSSSEDETRGHMKTQKQEESLILRNSADITQSLRSNSENQWPTLDLGQIPSIQRRLDIKAAVPRESLLKVDRERNLEGVKPSLTRQVHDKASSPLLQLGLNSKSNKFKKSESQSSSSESEDENRDQKAKNRKDQTFTSTASEKLIRFQIAPGIYIPYNPKTDHNIKLEKYTDISGDLEDMPTNDTSRTTLEVDPELQSRWATMNLGVSRFRKHLEISSHATESDLNSPADSSFTSGSESGSGRRQRLRRRFVGIQETHKSSSPELENVQLNVSPTPKSPEDTFTFSDIVKQRINKNHSDKDSSSPSKQSSNSSSSSDSEDETKDHSVIDLSRGVPRIKRRLDIKAPSPEPSNTPPFLIGNEDLTEHNALQSTQASTIIGPTDESLITYKRSIFKSLSLPSSSFTPNGSRQTVSYIPNLSKDGSNDKDTSLSSKAPKSTSFDDIIKRRLRPSRSKTDGDLMEKIKWTHVGHHLPDLSSSKSREGVDVTSKSLPQASFTELTSPSNDSESSTTAFSILQLSKKSDATQTHKYSSLGPEVAPSPSGDVLRVLGNSSQRTPEIQRAALGDKNERKGLSALKAMSRDRRNWEGDEDRHLVFDTQDGSISSHSQSEKDKVLSQQSQIHSPSASESKKDMDLLLLYGVPRYKRHGIGDSLTETSRPDPATPQQDD
ncbi:leucine-rich repeat-containing protein 66 [Xiphophorus maculatus]|uniref:Leucine rich repeat containing 66 n=1 Tax=Xiphophorus maculatus TaxID=8083 RepID=A0A3B5Q8B3_XIPMA|nr:leucine-rich repeat-containing protein 66 [Xiphophorus maculatus]